MKIIFRKASHCDLEAIVRIYDKCHDAEEKGLLTTGWLRGIYPVRPVAEASLERGDMYVAEAAEDDSEDFSIVASGVINQIQVDVYSDCDWIYKGPEDDVSVLHTLAVDPDMAGKGIGTAFVRFWEDLARKENRSILRIDTNAINERARRMYAKLGYVERGVVPTVFNGIPGVDLVMMEKFIGTEIQRRLRELQDDAYADFQIKLIPGKDRDSTIGVRTPQLRAYAKELLKNGGCKDFLSVLPHRYFDEMQLHAFIISEIRDFDICIAETERLLPHVDNWATCDQLSPKVFAKNRDKLLPHIDEWMESEHTYTKRFGIGMLMQHFLDGDFDRSYMNRVASVRSNEYYINMMTAWYFSTALAKQYDAALSVLREHRLDRWTHNKAIQKAVESRRITPEQKEYLRTLRRGRDEQ